MKIRITQSVLAPAAGQVARHISSKPGQPHEGGMLLETFTNNDKTYLRLVGYDANTTGKGVVHAEVLEEGKILVPGHQLADLVRDLPNGDIVLETTEDSRELTVTAGRGVFYLPLLTLDEYPTLPNMPEEAGRIDGGLFAAAVTKVARAASKDIENLQGVRIEVSKDTMTLVATDTFRLALCTLPWKGTDISSSAYISAKTLTAAANQFARSGELRVALEAGASSNFGLAGVDSAVIVQQAADTFPAGYRRLFVDDFTSKITVNVASLIETSKRVAKFTTDGSKAKFTLAEGKLTISGSDNGRASEEVDVIFEGEDLEIHFNPLFLIEGLSALGTEEAEITFRGAESVATLKGHGGDAEFTYLVMPVRG